MDMRYNINITRIHAEVDNGAPPTHYDGRKHQQERNSHRDLQDCASYLYDRHEREHQQDQSPHIDWQGVRLLPSHNWSDLQGQI